MQSMPLLAGAGFVHVRERLRAPVPELHVSEHAPQDPQSAQFPFTEKRCPYICNHVVGQV